MTTVGFYIGPGATDYSQYIIQADTWREALTGIGRWEVILDPLAGFWPGNFGVDDHVHIQIDGSTKMRGYIDDILPFMQHQGDISGYDVGTTRHTGRWKLVGRDRGMDLAQHYVTGEWENVRADNLVQTFLGIVPTTEITYVSPGVAPFIDYEANRTFLGDAIRDIAQLVNYDFYVTDTAPGVAPVLHFFPVGAAAEHTGTDLYLFQNVAPTASLCPILDIEVGEAVGFGTKNYVEAHTGSLMDHWTDLNAADWTPMAGNTVADDVLVFRNGKGAIRCTNTAGAVGGIRMDLDFSALGGRYDYGPTGIYQLDLSEPSMASFNYYVHNTWVGAPPAVRNVRIRLRDNAGIWIEYNRGVFAGLAKCFNCTDQPNNDEWRKVDFPVGDECGIEAAPVVTSKGSWGFIAGAAFNWANVDMIRFGTTINTNNNDYFIIDGLQLPNVEVVSVQQNALSQAMYGVRMRDIYRPDISNQIELDAFATRKLAELAYPKETVVRVASRGQCPNNYAGQSLDVVAPLFGIGGPLIGNTERYRILQLHHKVVRNSDASEYPGFTFTTEWELVKHTFYVGTIVDTLLHTQLIDQPQIMLTGYPDWATQEKRRLLERYRKRAGQFYPYP